MQIYRTCPNDDKALTYLNKLGEDNWIYCGTLGDKLIFRKEVKKTITRTTPVEDDTFQEFYGAYPNKKNRQGAIKEWCKLSEEEKQQAIKIVPIYKKWCEHKYTENGKLVKDKILHPDTYLRNKRWNDEIEIDGKSKSDILKEKEMIEKRRQEEKVREKATEAERTKADDVTTCIKRLKEQGLWLPVIEEAKSICPKDAIFATIDYSARKLVSDNLTHYKSLLKF